MEGFNGFGAFIALGTNLADRLENLRTAVNMIEEKAGKVVLRSYIYESAPYGNQDQPDFYNAVIGILTERKPPELLKALKEIEADMGRTTGEKWGPRIIDLDIILFGDMILDGEELKIPHADFRKRDFVLRPLKEIARMITDPVTGKTVGELYAELETDSCKKIELL